ncbi:MAG TPA: hypothetical protein VNY36_00375, partial [Bacteroidia bacterium]|nr:hypothetical protein [Bacteroidia bacterium]
MLTKLKQLFLKPPEKWTFWILAAFCARLLFFFLQIHIYHGGSIWAVIHDDTNSYLLPIENLINKGSYTPDFRMPGYGIIYLPLLLFFKKTMACNILILVQLLFSTISVYLLALITQRLFKHNAFFYVTFYLF